MKNKLLTQQMSNYSFALLDRRVAKNRTCSKKKREQQFFGIEKDNKNRGKKRRLN